MLFRSQMDYKIFVGLPALSSIHANYGNNGFDYNRLINFGTGLQSDSLVFYPDKLLRDMRPTTYISLESHINLLAAAYKYKNNYITFFATEKVELRIGIPRDLVKFIWKGNGAFLGKTADFSNLGVDAIHYREYALGWSKPYNDKIMLGAKAKLLFGKSNIQTKQSNISIYTDPNNYNMQVNSEMEINGSIPFIQLDYNYNPDVDSIELDVNDNKDFEVSRYLKNNKNWGLALDLGGSYAYDSKTNIWVSLIDFGFIKWKTDLYNITQNGSFTWQGINGQPYLNEGDTSDHMEEFVDSLANIFKVTERNNEYYTYLTPKIYIGGTYKLSEKIDVGLLTKTEIYDKKLHSSLTISSNANFWRWLGLCASYSIINNSFDNIGLGLAARGGPIQFYIVNDNILGTLQPYATRNINIRFGINLIFGYKEKEKASTLIGN